MPKKYKQKSLLTKPKSSAHSNLSLSTGDTPEHVPVTKSVNDLIRESRRGTGNERPQPVETASSIPPSLRAVLDIPAPPPPEPRIGIRGPSRLRRIPGPPPPRSWLTDSVHAPPQMKDIQWSKAHERSRIQQQNSNLPGATFPDEKTLQHAVLKRMAMNWSWHTKYDHEYLAGLPGNIKQTLLSYISIYNDGKGPNPMRLLFPVDLDQDELEEIIRLDFSNAIGVWTTLKKIERELGANHTASTSKRRIIPSHQNIVPDTWDEVDDAEQAIPASLHTHSMRFRNLKHLSLAVPPGTPGSAVSWAALLTIATNLSTITSLSLAYWPQPTYTPNASGGMVKAQNPNLGPASSILYGGSNFYTAFDGDWREAAGMLRSLSRSLYCLKWLDLTGCGHWFPALTWHYIDENGEVQLGPDWNGSWRGLEQLIMAVGWSPGPPPTEPPRLPLSHDRSLHASDEIRHTELSVRSRLQALQLSSERAPEASSPEPWNVEDEREKYYYRLEVKKWVEIRDSASKVAKKIRAIRKEHGGRWINVDLGPSENFATEEERSRV